MKENQDRCPCFCGGARKLEYCELGRHVPRQPEPEPEPEPDGSSASRYDPASLEMTIDGERVPAGFAPLPSPRRKAPAMAVVLALAALSSFSGGMRLEPEPEPRGRR